MTSIPLRPVVLRVPAVASRRLISRLATRDGVMLAGVVVVALAGHGINLFDFPYYHDDEGIYMAQAWAVASQGTLAPYTYWYDHAPLGWVQLAIWSLVTGGFSTFGTAIESGRLFMLAMHAGSTILVYTIARSVSGRAWVALLAALLFTLNGYGLFWQRRVMLDNIAAFWMLVSVALLVVGRPSLKRVWLSAVVLGISVLSKEVTVFLIPVMSYLAYQRVHRVQRWFAAIGWPAIAGSLVSLYLLFAALKGELFPTGTLLGGDTEHVSLFGTLAWQTGRGKDAGVFQPDSQFWNIVNGNWAVYEPLLVVGGTLAAMGLSVLVRRDVRMGAIGLLSLSLWAFLARGGIVYDQYLLPLVPLLALSLALALGAAGSLVATTVRRVSRWADEDVRRVRSQIQRRTGKMAAFSARSGRDRQRKADRRQSGRQLPGVGHQGAGSSPAAPALRGVLPFVAVAVVIPLLLTGYRNPNFGAAGDMFSYWSSRQASGQRAALDWVYGHISPSSAIVMDASFYVDLHDWSGAEYTLAHHYFKVDLDPEIRDGVFEGTWRNVDYVLADATLKHQAEWDELTIVLEAIEHSTPIIGFNSGWPIDVLRVNRVHQVEAEANLLLAHLGDRTAPADPNAFLAATSTGPSPLGAAMLQAAYAGDRAEFERLLSDASRASADPDVVLAALVADQRWPSVNEVQGTVTKGLAELWQSIQPTGPLLLPGRLTDAGLEVDMGALAPEAYRTFAAVDSSRDWEAVADSVYALMAQVQRSGSDIGSPTTAIVDDGRLAVMGESDGGPSPLPLRMAIDWLWHAEPAPRQALVAMGQALGDQLGSVDPTTADTELIPRLVYRDLPIMLAMDREEDAARIYASRILGPGMIDADGLGDAALDRALWYGVALMDGSLADIVDGERVIDWQRAMVVAPER